MSYTIVWFKRDLRVHDHAPKQQALDFFRRPLTQRNSDPQYKVRRLNATVRPNCAMAYPCPGDFFPGLVRFERSRRESHQP